MAAASEDFAMRTFGYDVLEQVLALLEEDTGGKGKGTTDWGSLAVLMKALRDSITEPLMV